MPLGAVRAAPDLEHIVDVVDVLVDWGRGVTICTRALGRVLRH